MNRSPSIDVFGSFFPIWIVCIALALLITAVLRFVLIRLNLESELGPRVVIYPAMVTLFACSVWLLIFHS